jgi:thiosulfate/3-mercaptopyruvate sulfurtransferase
MFARRAAALLAATLFTFSSAPAQSATGESLLISAAELQRSLNDPALILLYVGPKPDYDAGHIAGARFVQMQDLAMPRAEGALSLELPPVDDLRGRLERLGISDHSKIVVIPGEDWGSPATRVVFTLQASGLGDRTRLLDGGSRGWKAAGLPVTKDEPAAARPGRITVAADRAIVVDHAFMTSGLASSGFKLLDGRAPMFYEGAGMREGGMNHDAGHIPGAKNVPFNLMFDNTVKLNDRAELRRLFDAAGVKPGDTIVAYCHIGQQATAVLFAARVLGHPVKLYDGSMNEWELKKGPLENDKKPATPPRH